ncbi:Aldehyde/histidinol dehydrogenase [Trichoderma sp. SZMC 28012]
MKSNIIPLIIDGNDIVLEDEKSVFVSNPDSGRGSQWKTQGVTPELCRQALESSTAAFPKWRKTSVRERQVLFQRVVELLKERASELSSIVAEELGCSSVWASINFHATLEIIEQVTALITSGILSGLIPETESPDSLALIFKDPLGVVLGIAPWNAPAMLGMRSIAAAVAAGNCAILKGSELSPRTHYFIANLFRDAGFPPGVVNFLVHKPEDASDTFNTLISHPSVRKCNFTGSTAVGRHIASQAGHFLKPVLLELGGKNFSLVLEDADLENTASTILDAAFINSGQICMSTDIVLVPRKLKSAFCTLVRQRLESASAIQVKHVINRRSTTRILGLLDDAARKGATVITASSLDGEHGPLYGTVIEGLTKDMEFWQNESFGPVVGIATYDTVDEAVEVINECEYGLSGAIYTASSLQAIPLARRIDSGAVHINGPTFHDGFTLPHGGHKNSGFGRFGSHWAFEEFLQTKTVIAN